MGETTFRNFAGIRGILTRIRRYNDVIIPVDLNRSFMSVFVKIMTGTESVSLSNLFSSAPPPSRSARKRETMLLDYFSIVLCEIPVRIH